MHEKGLADRTKAIQLDPELPEAWYARGSAYYLMGDYAKARADMQEALRLRPSYEEAADVLKKAEEKLAEASVPQPTPSAVTPAATKEALTVAPSNTVEPVKAPVAAVTPPRIEPPRPQSPPKPAAAAPAPKPPAPVPAASAEEHERRGRALTESGNYPDAIAELTEAIRLKPNLARAYNARGYAYLRARDYQHALADFNDAIRLDANYTNAYKNRAATKKALGDQEGAAADLARGK